MAKSAAAIGSVLWPSVAAAEAQGGAIDNVQRFVSKKLFGDPGEDFASNPRDPLN